MAAKVAKPPEPTAIERRLQEHQAEIARLRAEFGDPAEALDAFIRETFNREAIIETYEEYLNEGHGSPEPNEDLGPDG